jgi:hypothetical protein
MCPPALPTSSTQRAQPLRLASLIQAEAGWRVAVGWSIAALSPMISGTPPSARRR